MIDNWQHRSANMRCESCMWYAPKAAEAVESEEKSTNMRRPDYFGRCRRHAPTMTGFPAVYGTDWCGDHKLDEYHA